MKRLIPILVILFLIGCSTDILRIRTKGKSDVTESPKRTYKHVENNKKLAAFSADWLSKISFEGAPEKSPGVAQATVAAKEVSADLGIPASPLSVPPPGDFSEIPVAEEVIKSSQKERTSYGKSFAKWLIGIAKLASKPQEKEFRIGIPILGYVGGGLLMVALGFALRYGIKMKSVLLSTFLGIKGWLGEAPDAIKSGPRRELLNSLWNKMSKPDKKVVKDLYRKVEER